jgi:DNA ligase (NAD+)
VWSFFRRAVNQRVIDRCLARGVRVRRLSGTRAGALTGKTVVFTGGLTSMTRGAAEARARAEGAHTARTVSRATDLLVAGRAPGSKYRKARALGIPIVDERRFQQLVADRA